MTNNEERKAWHLYRRANSAENRALQAWFAIPLSDTKANDKAKKTWDRRHATTERRYAEWLAESRATVARMVDTMLAR